ncbi:DNA alkylation repair protein [Acutalibacter intestini]|uniref:DNA alkylation repair protein n=1 Tax=Acutalibacter intestini TaxID=3093659 RepID=UPI002AC9AEE1|nr:DNA alkylation repair protein [Acutalibacter sp. M00204]
MNCSEVIAELKIRASEKYKANVVRMGIPEQYSLGVSTAEVRSLAKKMQKSNELALGLWVTGYHEARLLAVLLMDPKGMTKDGVEQLIGDVISWDLCDHLCKNLLIKMDCRSALIEGWITSSQTYRKRAAFTLIASSVVHDKKLTDDMLDYYLGLIARYSDDEREHAKKAA